MTTPEKKKRVPPSVKPAKNHPWRAHGGPKPDSQRHVAYGDRMGVRG